MFIRPRADPGGFVRLRIAVTLAYLGLTACAVSAQELAQESIPNWTAAPFWQPAASLRKIERRFVGTEGVEAIESPATVSAPLPFIAITPCRIMDTRNASQTGAFGPPSLGVDVSRSIPVPTHPVCTGIPATAGAYSLNMTVTNTGSNPFGFLKVWPQGAAEPNVSTLNWSSGGQTIANAAIVPAGTAGGITVKSGNASSDVIIDINGYYAGTIVSSLLAGTGVSVSSPTGNVTVGIANGGVALAQLSPTGSAAGQALVSTGAAVAWGSPVSFTGSLAGEVTGTQGATVVSNATSSNTASAIVRRDGAGGFNAGAVTLSGTLTLPATTGRILQGASLLLHTSGTDSTYAGVASGNPASTGTDDTGFGANSLPANTTGTSNSAFGSLALESNDTGSQNTGVGTESIAHNIAGDDNTAIGAQSLHHVTGNRNIGIGTFGGFNLVTGDDNILVGNQGVTTESSTIRIGSVQTKTFIAGIRGVTTGQANGLTVLVDSNGQLGTVSSSAATKREITDIDGRSSDLLKLRPVSFFYKNDTVGYRQYGLVAEEVAQVMPDLVQYNAQGAPETVRYHFLAPLLLSEVQKLEQTVEAQRRLIGALEERLSALEKQTKPAE